MTDIEDKKQPGRINSIMYELITDAFEELHHNIRIGMKDQCIAYRSLKDHAKLHSMDRPVARSIYDKEQLEMDAIYGKNNEELTVTELVARLQSIMDLLNRTGTLGLRERYSKPMPEEAMDVAIGCFEYDTYRISGEEPLVKTLADFYFEELKDEYEKKPIYLRKKESVRRAKRAYEFYRRYEIYRESGFDQERIEEIFGITLEEQKLMNFWIDEFVSNGKPTVIFASTGSGKSNLSSVVIQIILILRPEWDIGTNLTVVCSPEVQEHMEEKYRESLKSYQIPQVRMVSNFTELLNLSTDKMLEGKYLAVILDEMDSSTPGTQSRSKEGVSWQAYTWVERHLDTKGPLLVYHEQSTIPKGMRIGGMTKQIFGMYQYENYANHHSRRAVSRPDYWDGTTYWKMYFPPPLTSLPYHTKGWSSFVLDVDMQWINQRVGNVPKLEAARRIKELVKGRGWEKERKGEIKKGREE